MQKNIPPKEKDKKVLTLFIVSGLSLLIGIAGFLPSELEIYKAILIAVILFIQGVIMKNILDDYYMSIE